MTIGHIGYWAAVTVGLGCLIVVISLIVIRLHADATERRTQAMRTPLWREVLTLGAGEPDEVEAATQRLLSLSASEREAIEDDTFALVPKLRGEARQRVRDVLRAWGSVDHARNSTTSPSPVRRSRGYYRLGVLALPERRDEVLGGLHDRDFTARRTAMLALASFPEHDVVEAMLLAATDEPRLRHDFLAAVDQMGAAAAPVMVEHLRTPTSGDPDRERRLAAEAVGLVGEVDAVSSIEVCLLEEDDELRIAALQALGALGSPSSVIAVTAQLGADSRDVRQAAVEAAGKIGGPSGLMLLSVGLGDDDVEVARAAAEALRRAGTRGHEILSGSSTPVAREALALAALREPAA